MGQVAKYALPAIALVGVGIATGGFGLAASAPAFGAAATSSAAGGAAAASGVAATAGSVGTLGYGGIAGALGGLLTAKNAAYATTLATAGLQAYGQHQAAGFQQANIDLQTKQYELQNNVERARLAREEADINKNLLGALASNIAYYSSRGIDVTAGTPEDARRSATAAADDAFSVSDFNFSALDYEDNISRSLAALRSRQIRSGLIGSQIGTALSAGTQALGVYLA